LAEEAPLGVLTDPARLRSVARLGVGPHADPAFDRIADLVERLVDVPVAAVTVITADRQFFPGQVGLPEHLAASREMPLSLSLSRHVLEEGAALIIPDVREVPHMRDNQSIRDLGAIAFAGVPITDSEGLILGTIAAMDQEPRVWTRSEIALLDQLAEICSSELRLRIEREIAEEARRHAESAHNQLSLLGELTETLSAPMDVDEALGRLGQMVAGRLSDWCLVALAEANGRVRHVSAAHSAPAYAQDAARLAELAVAAEPDLKALILKVQRTGTLIRRDAVDVSLLRDNLVTAELATTAERLGFGSFLIVPITAPVTKRILGALMLVNATDRPPFGEAEEQTASEIGRRAGLAVDNSRLYRNQRHVAEVLQQSMLPDLPHISGIDMYARYLPAQGGNAEVGGDWYDAFAQPDGSVMLAVGDVSGHDIEAAATMGQVRNLVRGDAYGRQDDPGPLLAQLDRALHGLGVPAAATAVLARVRREADHHHVAFANAGHPPPILLSPDGTIDVWWAPPEPLLGLLPRAARTTHHRNVPPGSTLLLYTDGLVEHPARLIDEGIARIRGVLQGNAALPPEELCSRLINSASRRTDDIALLAVCLR
jgi:GAF domain-containing protein